MKRLLCLCLLVLATGACSRSRPAAELYNAEASTPAGAGFNPMDGSVITSYLDPKAATTSTLFGNDVAMHGTGTYAPGSVLRLVTWQQQADPNWLGARIPAKMASVETLTFASDGGKVYERREGPTLTVDEKLSETAKKERADWITGLRPAVMP
jgi:hypothetical protein